MQHTPEKQQRPDEKYKGKLTVEKAGHKGGQRVRELVKEGKEEEPSRMDKERANSEAPWRSRCGAPATSSSERLASLALRSEARAPPRGFLAPCLPAIPRHLWLFVQTVFDLVENFRKLIRVGAQVARMVPLELRLELAAHAPIGVAQMIVDHRV